MLAEPPSPESDRADIDKIIKGLEQVKGATTHLLDGHHKDMELNILAALNQIQFEARYVAKRITDGFPDVR